MPRMKREQLLEIIRVEVAMHGKVTALATRLYIEHRISREAFNSATRQGLAAYRARQGKEQQSDGLR